MKAKGTMYARYRIRAIKNTNELVVETDGFYDYRPTISSPNQFIGTVYANHPDDSFKSAVIYHSGAYGNPRTSILRTNWDNIDQFFAAVVFVDPFAYKATTHAYPSRDLTGYYTRVWTNSAGPPMNRASREAFAATKIRNLTQKG